MDPFLIGVVDIDLDRVLLGLLDVERADQSLALIVLSVYLVIVQSALERPLSYLETYLVQKVNTDHLFMVPCAVNNTIGQFELIEV